MDWHSLLLQEVSVQPGKTVGIQSFCFSVTAEMQQLRMRCQFANKAVPKPDWERTLQAYADHPTIDPSQWPGVQPLVQDQWEYLITRGWSVQVFDAERCFRGRWDPSFRDWKVLSTHHASAGFVGGPLPPGEWTMVVLSVPDIDPGQLTIEIESTAESDLVQAMVPYDLSCETVHSSEPQWVVGELHEHSDRSTGQCPPNELVKRYHELGYQFLVLSDHDVQPLSALESSPPIGVIRGQELESPQGHAMLLGIGSHVSWHENGRLRSIREAVHHTHSQRALFQILHPFSLGRDGRASGWRWRDTDWMNIDLIEIWSGEWNRRYPEILKAFDHWDELLNQGFRIYGTCGKGGCGEIDGALSQRLPKTLLYTDGLSESQLLVALKQGHFYSTIEPGIIFRVETNLGQAGIGDTIRIRVGETFRIFAAINGAGPSAYVRIRTNDGIYCERPLSSIRESTDMEYFHDALQGVQWFRVEVFRYGRPIDQLLAFTNPIFVYGMMSM